MVEWDEMASSYRRQLWLESGSLAALLELLDPGPGERLLDIATGPAVLLAELARRPRCPEAAVGIDASAAMIAAAPPLPPAWLLQVADAERLPFADGSFDLITASYLLHVLDATVRAAVLAECVRVLRPGGRLGAITIAPPRTRLGAALSAPLRAAASRSGGRLATLRPLDPGPELERAGFTVLTRRHSFRGYPALCLLAQLTGGADEG